MTDSSSGPNGPNLKFAALSVDSYHLDSPPFTGAAVGTGSSAQHVDGLDAAGRNLRPANHHRTSSSNGASGADAGNRSRSQSSNSATSGGRATDDVVIDGIARGGSSVNGNVAHGNGDTSQQSTTSSASSSSRDRGSSNSHHHNHDVPSWNLDEHNRQIGTAATTPATPRQSLQDGNADIPQHVHYRRPLHTQLIDDADGVQHGGSTDHMQSSQHEPDQEVDGDGTGFVLRTTDGSVASHDEIVPIQSQRKADYNFPRHRLPLKMRDESKIPLVIVACGSFSPPTYLHLRIFEMAKDQVIESGKYELLAGYYSPVSDHYKKAGLAQARHRVRMCELAVEKTSTWLMVDAWESLQDEYQRTAVVLDHFNEELNGPLKTSSDGGPPQPIEGGVLLNNGRRRRIKIMLLAGGDLIQSMGEPGVWADTDLHHILGRYGCMIVERTGADVWSFLLSHDLLWRYRRNLKIVKQTIYNDISSSKVRLFVRRGQSIKYLLPNSVIKYIEQNALVSNGAQRCEQSTNPSEIRSSLLFPTPCSTAYRRTKNRLSLRPKTRIGKAASRRCEKSPVYKCIKYRARRKSLRNVPRTEHFCFCTIAHASSSHTKCNANSIFASLRNESIDWNGDWVLYKSLYKIGSRYRAYESAERML